MASSVREELSDETISFHSHARMTCGQWMTDIASCGTYGPASRLGWDSVSLWFEATTGLLADQPRHSSQTRRATGHRQTAGWTTATSRPPVLWPTACVSLASLAASLSATPLHSRTASHYDTHTTTWCTFTSLGCTFTSPLSGVRLHVLLIIVV